MASFFADPEVQQLLARASTVLRSNDHDLKRAHLARVLGIVLRNAQQFDERCQTNIEWIGEQLRARLRELIDTPQDNDTIDDLYSMLYRFMLEFDLGIADDLSSELRGFIRFAQEGETNFNDGAQRQLRFADRQMPAAILKKVLGSGVLQNIRNVEKFSQDVDASFAQWNTQLDERQVRAEQLGDALKNFETAFNFVGLYKGFDDLSRQKKSELRLLRRYVLLLGMLAVAPILAEIGFLGWKFAEFESVKWALIASAIPAFSLTVIFVYFFRLGVRNAENVKSQLLQIELRKTLCQFIQNYAEYAKKIQNGNADILSKFENVVFSGIVGSDEKMPATFDGLEQIANLVKSVRAN